LYWSLASLPGFNLFRVPARWLALFALGMALLAAVGLQRLRDTSRPRIAIFGVIALIISGLAASSTLTLRQPDLTPVSLPTNITLIGWLVALVVLLLLVWRRAPRWLALAAVVELFLASQVLPFNDLSSPEVYENRRFTTNQLLAYRDQTASPVFGRLLSISELLFDPRSEERRVGRVD